MSLRTLAILSLIALTSLASACGSSERRGTATGYDGPAQAENEEPEGSAIGGGGYVESIITVLRTQLEGELAEVELSCECTFEIQGYDDAASCIDDQTGGQGGFGNLDEGCIREAAAAQPDPPQSLISFFSVAEDAVDNFERCVDAIDVSSCPENPEAAADAFDACDDQSEAAFEGLVPTDEDEAWLDGFESSVEALGCFDFGFGGGGQTPPGTGGGMTPEPDPVPEGGF